MSAIKARPTAPPTAAPMMPMEDDEDEDAACESGAVDGAVAVAHTSWLLTFMQITPFASAVWIAVDAEDVLVTAVPTTDPGATVTLVKVVVEIAAFCKIDTSIARNPVKNEFELMLAKSIAKYIVMDLE